MTRLTLALLGPPEVRHGDRLLSFPTRKALALLIYLAAEGGMQPREKLASLFWPESSHKAGRASLRTTLAALRKELDHANADQTHSHLRVERSAIGFNRDAAYELDLETVQAAFAEPPNNARSRAHLTAKLRTALDLIRGEFLEGFSLPDAPQFDDWVSFHQEQWHLRLNQIFDRLSALQSEAGDAATAVTTLNRWLILNPLAERAYRQLMQAYLVLQDRPGALQVYEKCRSVLAAELGIEPAPETAALAERIRAAGQVRQQQTDRVTKPAPAHFGMPLAGRAEAHSELVTAYHYARRGEARVITLEGEAGIGKTHLAYYFLNWAAAQGATILRSRAFETGGRLPYQPVVDAWRSAPIESIDLSPTWWAELSRLLPELREAFPDLPAPTSDESAAQTRLFEAAARLGQCLAANAPLVFFIDDVQWTDAASRDLLQYTAHRWLKSQAPIMLLFGLRTEALSRTDRSQSDTSLREWLSRLAHTVSLKRHKLTPLSAADTQQLVSSLGFPADQIMPLAKWLFAETAGQPFYLAETLKALVDEGVLIWRQDETGEQRLNVRGSAIADRFRRQAGYIPPGVRDLILGRLARLSAAAFRLLAAGAVLGQAFSYRQLCQVAGLTADDGLAALDELLAANLLVETGAEAERPYLFTHDKIRAVVYTEAGDARRRLFHERAYELLANRQGAAAPIAHHALAAGLVKPAFTYALAAGNEAMDFFAVQDAVAQYEQARSVLQKQPQLAQKIGPAALHHLYRRLGRGYELLDDWEQAQKIETEMRDVAGEIADVPMKVTALNRLATVAVQSRLDVEEAARLLETAVTLAETHDDQAGLAEAEWNLAQTCFYRRNRPGAIRHGERALQLAQTLERPKLIARSHNILSYAKSGPASLPQLAEARNHAAAARDLYASLGNRAMEIDCLNMLGSIDIHSGRPAAAESRLRHARDASIEIGNVWGQANTAFNLAQALLELGHYGEALARASESVAAAQSGEPTPMTAGTLAVRGGIWRALLALDEALADHLTAKRLFVETPNSYVTHLMAADLCADYALAGEWDEAHHYARQAVQYDRADAWLFSGFSEWLLVAALLRGGDVALARQTIREFGDLIGDNPRYQIPYRRAQALLAEYDGDETQGVAHLEAALALAKEIGLPGEKWSILAALANRAEKRGDEATAVSLRQQASEIIDFIAGQIDDPELRARFVRETAVRFSIAGA